MRRTSRWIASAALIALAACTSEGENPRGGGGGPPPRPPRGEVVVVVVGDPATLDPYAKEATSLTRALVRPVYRSLYRLRPDGTPAPDLVRRLEAGRGQAVVHLVREAEPRDVLASARRARWPSGFAGLHVRRAGPRAVLVRGNAGDWPRRLARGTWVLPRGRATGDGGGPYRIARHRRGFEVVLKARRATEEAPRVARIRVKIAASSDVALGLLHDGRADVGWIPSSVNLAARVDAAGLDYEARRGWESVVLDFSGSHLAPAQRRWVVHGAGLPLLAEGFIREAGERVRARHAGPRLAPDDLLLAAPSGDELLRLMLRAVHHRLSREGVAAEAVAVPAGDPLPATAVTLVRVIGAPGLAIGNSTSLFPLFRVDSAIVSRGLEGPRPNPTLDGPLWNVETWRTDGQR